MRIRQQIRNNKMRQIMEKTTETELNQRSKLRSIPRLRLGVGSVGISAGSLQRSQQKKGGFPAAGPYKVTSKLKPRLMRSLAFPQICLDVHLALSMCSGSVFLVRKCPHEMRPGYSSSVNPLKTLSLTPELHLAALSNL